MGPLTVALVLALSLASRAEAQPRKLLENNGLATAPVQAACPPLDIVLTALRLVSPLLADDRSFIQVQCVSNAGQEYAAASLPVTQATFRAPGGRVAASGLQLLVAQLPCDQAVSCRIRAVLPSSGGDAAPTTDELFSSEDPSSCWFPYRYFANGAYGQSSMWSCRSMLAGQYVLQCASCGQGGSTSPPSPGSPPGWWLASDSINTGIVAATSVICGGALVMVVLALVLRWRRRRALASGQTSSPHGLAAGVQPAKEDPPMYEVELCGLNEAADAAAEAPAPGLDGGAYKGPVVVLGPTAEPGACPEAWAAALSIATPVGLRPAARQRSSQGPGPSSGVPPGGGPPGGLPAGAAGERAGAAGFRQPGSSVGREQQQGPRSGGGGGIELAVAGSPPAGSPPAGSSPLDGSSPPGSPDPAR